MALWGSPRYEERTENVGHKQRFSQRKCNPPGALAKPRITIAGRTDGLRLHNCAIHMSRVLTKFLYTVDAPSNAPYEQRLHHIDEAFFSLPPPARITLSPTLQYLSNCRIQKRCIPFRLFNKLRPPEMSTSRFGTFGLYIRPAAGSSLTQLTEQNEGNSPTATDVYTMVFDLVSPFGPFRQGCTATPCQCPHREILLG